MINDMDEQKMIGKTYKHKNGNLYKVLMLTNTEGEVERQDKYPPTVVYQGEDKKLWSARLDDWDRRMTEVVNIEHGPSPYMVSVSTTYTQEGDGNSPEFQDLVLSTEDCGGGNYFVLSTQRWAFDTIEEFIKLFKDFEMRAS